MEWAGWKEGPDWRQEVSSTLVEIQELLREKNGAFGRGLSKFR